MRAKLQEGIYKVPIIEVILSMISSWWAIVLFNSPHMFDRLGSTYVYFERIADERHWAIIFATAALIKIIGIIIKSTLLRKMGLIASAIIYGLIAYAYFSGVGWFSIGFGTFTAMSIMAFWGIRECDSSHA